MALKPARLQWSADGSIESADYGDVYFQRQHGLAETDYVFLQGSNLAARFAALSGPFRIAETGFGSGLNFLLTAKLFLDTAPQSARLVFTSAEKHPLLPEDLKRVHDFFPDFATIAQELQAQYPPLIDGFHTLRLMGGRIRLILAFGDIADTLPEISGRFDAWFLDGFSPKKNPDMWGEWLYPLVAARTMPGGTVATFSSAGHVRRGLAAAGFAVKKIPGYGFKWSMTTAVMPPDSPVAQPPISAIVLGAGIAGSAVARALAERGCRVTVIDRQPDCASETSGNPVGILYPKLTVDPSPMGGYHAHAFSLSRNMAQSLKLASWNACGVTHIDMTPEDAARRSELLKRNDYPAAYAHGTEKALHQPLAGFLSPPEYCKALLLHDSITCRFGMPVTDISHDGTQWHAGDLSADILVIALGNDSGAFEETKWLPLQSLRGQVTLLKPTAESQKIETVLCHDGYITPLKDGLHCIGATFQKEDAGIAETRPQDDAENLAQLKAALPQFGFTPEHIAGSRAGYRATTPDKLPLIGPCPGYAAAIETFGALRGGGTVDNDMPVIPGLYISTGFGAHGMTGAPLAGEIIAALATGDPLPVPQSLLAHLLPGRFILRDLKRGKI